MQNTVFLMPSFSLTLSKKIFTIKTRYAAGSSASCVCFVKDSSNFLDKQRESSTMASAEVSCEQLYKLVILLVLVEFPFCLALTPVEIFLNFFVLSPCTHIHWE